MKTQILMSPIFRKKIILFILVIGLFTLNSCKSNECEYLNPCGGSASKPVVDLVVLIDASGSMSSGAAVISAEAQAAIDSALLSCSSDLRVTYLGLDGTFAGTNFTTDHRSYLYGIHGSGITLAADQPYVGYTKEQGANAVQDISKYFDWRLNACKVIYYISDEELDGFAPRGDAANEDATTAAAIADANLYNVAVFSTFLTYQLNAPGSTFSANTMQNYIDLTSLTGGTLNTVNTVTPGYFSKSKVFQDIICNACNGCK